MLRLLPKEIREKLWKFTHYISHDEIPEIAQKPIAYLLYDLDALEVDNYIVEASLAIPIDTPPLKPFWIMGYFVDGYKERLILYYSIDGMAVYIDYHTESNGLSMYTYQSKRIQDLFVHIDHIDKLLPDHDVWRDIL